jgi:type II secretory pathway predicted ATPase ExeA
VLIIDEGQEMFTNCLNELRLLVSADFDSQSLLTVVICGDMRLPERFRSNALLSLGSRIRVRIVMEAYSHDVLLDFLDHCLVQAGAQHLMTESLMETLVDHAAGNLRLLTNMAEELLEKAAEKGIAQLDEKLFLEVFSRTPSQRRSKQRG